MEPRFAASGFAVFHQPAEVHVHPDLIDSAIDSDLDTRLMEHFPLAVSRLASIPRVQARLDNLT